MDKKIQRYAGAPNSPETPEPKRDNGFLGLSTNELAGLSVEELTGNKTAITMVIHYYKQLVDENSSLKNDINAYKTYMDGYNRKKTNTAVGAILLAVSNVIIAFGVNLLTGGSIAPGVSTLIPGVVMAGTGLYFSFRDSE